MPSEAEVFLDHLNASRHSATAPPTPGEVPVHLSYLKERIRAVRHENRDLREGLEKIHRENQRLREELDKIIHDNKLLEG